MFILHIVLYSYILYLNIYIICICCFIFSFIIFIYGSVYIVLVALKNALHFTSISHSLNNLGLKTTL